MPWVWQCPMQTAPRHHPRQLRYWILPDGRAVVWSLLELVDKKLDELIDPAAPEAYFVVGQQLGCLPLGMLPDAERDA